jgi:hypothetical protein
VNPTALKKERKKVEGKGSGKEGGGGKNVTAGGKEGRKDSKRREGMGRE